MGTNKMFRILFTLSISFLVIEKASGDGKQCFECTFDAGSGEDTCEDFTDSTKKCEVADQKSCYKRSGKVEGKKVSSYGCEDSTSGTDICIQNKLDNKCKTKNGITLCCCDGDLCNSVSPRLASLLLILAAVSALWLL